MNFSMSWMMICPIKYAAMPSISSKRLRKCSRSGAFRERTLLPSLTAEAKPAWIAPFGDSLELGQAAKSPFLIVRVNAQRRQIIVTQPHQGPVAAPLKQKFDRRLPRGDADDAAPGIDDFAIGHDVDEPPFNPHSTAF